MSKTLIKCGNCTSGHETVAEVRKCFKIQPVPTSETLVQAPVIDVEPEPFPWESLDGEAEFDAMIAEREAREDALAAHAKMERDDATLSAPVVYDASKKQQNFVRDLLARRDLSRLSPGWVEMIRESLGDESRGNPMTLTKKAAGKAIDRMLGLPYRVKGEQTPTTEVTAKPEVTEDGMYRNPESGEIYKVQWNKAGGLSQGKGTRLYAKKLVVMREAERDAEGKIIQGADVIFQYAPGMMAKISPDWKMTKEQAREFGALYGTCVRCGRVLTAEDSIDRMMGPVCATKF